MPQPGPLRRALYSAVRCYVRHSSVWRGTGWLVRRVLAPDVPREGPLTVCLPSGARLRYEEALGHVVGTQGRVFSFGPHPAACERLRAHLEENGCRNVKVVEAAAGDRQGTLALHDAADSASASVVGVLRGHREGGRLTVPTTALDAHWTAAGRPRVRLVKVDVEGADVSALRGAAELLDVSHPALVPEANTPSALRPLRDLLGCGDRRPWGFDHHHRLFEAAGA